jgi:hypothetical protein
MRHPIEIAGRAFLPPSLGSNRWVAKMYGLRREIWILGSLYSSKRLTADCGPLVVEWGIIGLEW